MYVVLGCIAGLTGELLIDTNNAGEGTLTVKVDGPSKAELDTQEVDEGKKVLLQLTNACSCCF